MGTIGLGAIVMGLNACTTVQVFDALTPKDKNAYQIARDISYGENPRQKYDIYAPKHMVGNLPTIVFFYGGGWDWGSKDTFHWAGKALAALGYVVVLPNYRLVPEVTYPAFVEDCAMAVKHIKRNIEKYGGSSEQIALIGHSAGAYNAAMLCFDPEFLGVDLSAIKVFIGISGPYDFYPFDARQSINAFAGAKNPRETQPINHVTHNNIKTLLLHSRSDETVYLRNSITLEAKLKSVGNDVKLNIYDGPSHEETIGALSIPLRKKAPVLSDIETFLKGINFR